MKQIRRRASVRRPRGAARIVTVVAAVAVVISSCSPPSPLPPGPAAGSSPGPASTDGSMDPASTRTAAPSAGATVDGTSSTAGPVAADQPGPGPVGSGPALSGAELIGGGSTLLPGRRFVALYGSPGISGLGALGQQELPAAVDRVRRLAAEYQPLSDVPVVPMFEMIATIADVAPGEDGDYSAEIDPEVLLPWIDAANAAGIYVVLDLQPGRSDFLTQARRYESLLRRPNVGLALDPEWRLTPTQVHLQQIGRVDAAEVNAVGDWLSGIVRSANLPQKLFLLHQFRLAMLSDESAIVLDRPELATVIQMDGQGSQAAKDETWAAVTAAAPPGTPFGWKNFYRADDTLLDPAGTMAKSPTPVLVSYE